MPRSNLEQLAATAGLLGLLLEELVFVGGAVTGLLVTDRSASGGFYSCCLVAAVSSSW